MVNAELFNYGVVSEFNDSYYTDFLTKKDVSGSEKMVKEVTVFREESGQVIEDTLQVNDFFYILQKNNVRYLLESSKINNLPIMVGKSMKVGYNKEGFVLITEPKPVGFKPERRLSFRELIDTFAPFNHSNHNKFKLWKICAFSSYLDRINLRIASEPAFGKDSIIALFDDLFGRVGVVQKPTIAKLEYLTHNKLLLVNEFMNLSSQETRDIEQYLLTVGDFKNKYQKRSRASSIHSGSEEYDISKFSLILAFNTLTDYVDGDKIYFDKVHTKQLKERFLPLKFEGKITEDFQRINNPKQLAIDNKDFYVSMIKTVNWFSNPSNVTTELKPYKKIESNFTDRWKINFETICKFINLYSVDEKEYKLMVLQLYSCHSDYISMINNGNNTLNRPYLAGISEDIVDIQQIEEYIGE